MALPAQALLHRLREHAFRERAAAPWAAYMPARFHDGMGAGASTLGGARLASESAGTATPASALGSLIPEGSSGNVAGKVWGLSLEARGCREVQQALEEASDVERGALARELQGHVREASRCPHANYVVQKCISIVAPSMLQFVIDELMENDTLIMLARHKYGCRIVQRLLEHCPTEQVHDLVELLLKGFSEISQHCYGIFVMQKLLQHVAKEQRTDLLDLVEQHVSELALHPHGCAVLAAALEHGDLGDRYRLAEMLLEDNEQVAFMAGTKHGQTIITNLLDVLDGSGCQRLLALLEGNPKLEEALRCRSEEGSSDWCHTGGHTGHASSPLPF